MDAPTCVCARVCVCVCVCVCACVCVCVCVSYHFLFFFASEKNIMCSHHLKGIGLFTNHTMTLAFVKDG